MIRVSESIEIIDFTEDLLANGVDAGSRHVTTEADIDFSSLPQVE
jgi:hypothetical protein